MAIANNQQVSIEYELKSKGEVIDSNIGKEPLVFTFGSGQIIPGLESRIAHMEAGQSEEVNVPAAEAYGEYDEAATQTIPKKELGEIPNLEVGMPLQGQSPDGQVIRAVVKAIADEEVVVDFNHPLAGQDLDFTVKILQVI